MKRTDSWKTMKFISAEDTRSLRHRVLRPNQSLADCIYPGDDDPSSYHMGGFADDELVCVASVFHQVEDRFGIFGSDSQFRLRGMATVDAYRGQGFGKMVLQLCLDECWKRGGEVFWCNARTTAADYYEKMGFTTHDALFDLPGIGPHRMMYVMRG